MVSDLCQCIMKKYFIGCQWILKSHIVGICVFLTANGFDIIFHWHPRRDFHDGKFLQVELTTRHHLRRAGGSEGWQTDQCCYLGTTLDFLGPIKIA